MKGLGTAAASAAVLILGGAGGAFAADLAVKAPPYKAPAASNTCTSVLDFFVTACQVAAYGVRFYGTIDVGVSYQTNGARVDRKAGSGLTYNPQKMNNGAKWLPASYAMQGSNVGFQIAEPIGGGWKFVGQVEAGFDPYTLALKSVTDLKDDFGEQLGTAKGVADSPANGTFYNNLGFAGFSNDTWGTLTFGRQNSPFQDVLKSYDPAGGSNAFGLIGGNGSLGGGGSTETNKGTTAVKYRVNFANYHLGLFAQFGDYKLGNPAKADYQANLGGDFKIGPGLLSIDGAGGFTKDVISQALAIGTTAVPAILPGTVGVGNPLAPITGINATISDNTFAQVGAKYTIDRLKLYAGYEWVQFANPADGGVQSVTDEAGDTFVVGNPVFNINNGGFPNNKIWNLAYAGARYSLTDAVDVYGGYYHLDQNQFGNANQVQNCGTNERSAPQCHGTTDSFTAVVDWKVAPKWDVYLGGEFVQLNGGLANGFLHTQFMSTEAGVRFRW